MKIISACRIDSNKYYVAFDTPYAGASVMDAVLDMDDLDFEIFNVPLFDSEVDAYGYAYNIAFDLS